MLSACYWLYINDVASKLFNWSRQACRTTTKLAATLLELPIFSVQFRYFCEVAIGPIRFELTYTATSIQHTILLLFVQENETLFNCNAFPSLPFNGKSPW